MLSAVAMVWAFPNALHIVDFFSVLEELISCFQLSHPSLEGNGLSGVLL